MMQTEEGKSTLSDRKELDRNIKALETEIENSNKTWSPHVAPEIPKKIKELRRLRRMRNQ